ncbi:MAG: phage holin family protein [Crocinitomicaceae bacterium]|nr:phage holin family protein [Crocinitomicaceae bacterium]
MRQHLAIISLLVLLVLSCQSSNLGRFGNGLQFNKLRKCKVERANESLSDNDVLLLNEEVINDQLESYAESDVIPNTSSDSSLLESLNDDSPGLRPKLIRGFVVNQLERIESKHDLYKKITKRQQPSADPPPPPEGLGVVVLGILIGLAAIILAIVWLVLFLTSVLSAWWAFLPGGLLVIAAILMLVGETM